PRQRAEGAVFFFEAEDEIRAATVTGVQTCALPISVDAQTRQELESLGYVSAGTPREIRLGSDAPDPKDRVEVLKTLWQVERLLKDRKSVVEGKEGRGRAGGGESRKGAAKRGARRGE